MLLGLELAGGVWINMLRLANLLEFSMGIKYMIKHLK